jgi:predicted amidophosphoribosyltransferase
MRCSSCANENPVGKKFCGGCGSSLSARCPRCGAENTLSFKFCGDCGASLSDRGFAYGRYGLRLRVSRVALQKKMKRYGLR